MASIQRGRVTRDQLREAGLSRHQVARQLSSGVLIAVLRGCTRSGTVWRDRRVVVEVDGFRFHPDRAAFERDQARDRAHVAGGCRVLRITARQLEREPLLVVAQIARTLG